MAVDTSQYLLTFDFQEFTRQVAELQSSYEMMTGGFQKSSSEMDESLRTLESRILTISTSLDSSYSKMTNFYSTFHDRLKESSGLFAEIDQNAKRLHEELKSIGGFNPDKAPTGGAPTPDKTAFTISGGGSNTEELQKSLAMAEVASRAARKAIDDAEKADKTWKKTSKNIGNYIVKEVKNAKSRVGSIISSFSQGVMVGGVLGLIGAMVLGHKETQRKGAERGEMANALESAGGLFDKATQKALGWASKFQEKAQYHFGIGRREIQGVIDDLAKAGRASEFLSEDFGKSVSDVNANILSTSIAMDKYLNKATGSSMKSAIAYTELFGGSIKGALSQLQKLDFEAQKSGMSMEKFVNSIVAGSSSLSQYRVDISEVATVMKGIRKNYEGMGLDSQQSGALAARVAEDMGGAFGGMSEAIRMDFFIKYYSKKGINLEGHQALVKGEEEFTNAGQGSSGILMDLIRYVNEDLTRGARDRYTKIHLAKARGGFSPLQAQSLVDLYSQNMSADGLNMPTPAQLKEFKDTFKTEGSKLTDIQKNQRDLIDGLAKIGEGILGTIANILGTLVMGIRALPTLLWSGFTAANPLSSKSELSEARGNIDKIAQAQKTLFDGMSNSASKISSGFDKMMGAIGDTEGIVDPSKAISTAANADIGSVTWGSVSRRVDDVVTSVGKLENSFAHQQSLLTELETSVKNRMTEMLGMIGVLDRDQVLRSEQRRDTKNQDKFDQNVRQETRNSNAKNNGVRQGASSPSSFDQPKFNLSQRTLGLALDKNTQNTVGMTP